MNKIFVQIASYRDPELIPTIEDCINNADYPENLVFSICWQHCKDDIWDNIDKFKNDSRFKIIDVDYKDSKGCCWARNLLQQQYCEEEYTLQLDSHHRFIKGWDTEIILMYQSLKNQGYEKPLITGYMPSYTIEADPKGRAMIPWKMNFDRFTPEGVVLFLPAYMDNFKELNDPIRARFYSAHFAFVSGSFVKEVPHDPNYYFHGEEISIGVRAFTHGYDLFHPHKLIAWHEYTRIGRTKVWSDDPDMNNKNEKCFVRNRKLFGMDKKDIDFGIFDFGSERTLEDYEKYAGISFKERSIQKYTLDNQLPPNPSLSIDDYNKSFVKIFKHCIDLHKNYFKDNDYDFWVVAYEDKDDKSLYRKDVDEIEIKQLLSTIPANDFITIWREFLCEERPHHWVVWLHSKSKGWLEKIKIDL